MTFPSLLPFPLILYDMNHYRVGVYRVFQMFISHLNVAISWPNRIKQGSHSKLSVVEQMDGLCQICQRE